MSALSSKSSRIVWQTEELICFSPLAPELFGHTLIAPRRHYADIRDAPTSFGASVFQAAEFLALLYERKLGSTGFNLLNASGKDAEQSACHLHFYFLPRFTTDNFSTWRELPRFRVDLDDLLAKVRGQNSSIMHCPNPLQVSLDTQHCQGLPDCQD